jgi:hypothetical protein
MVSLHHTALRPGLDCFAADLTLISTGSEVAFHDCQAKSSSPNRWIRSGYASRRLNS